jgi:LysM repeat protein
VTVQIAPVPRSRVRPSHFLAPLALAIFVAAVIFVVVKVPGHARPHPVGAKAAHVRRLPPYWVVHAGDTLTRISAKTGLSVSQLETFNPQADPGGLVLGERLNLWRYPPKPRPKPPGPHFWRVAPGDSFGSISAKTGINITKLEELNPQLKATTLQPGDRVRLRR